MLSTTHSSTREPGFRWKSAIDLVCAASSRRECSRWRRVALWCSSRLAALTPAVLQTQAEKLVNHVRSEKDTFIKHVHLCE